MSTTAYYRIHVAILGRKDDIKSALYTDKAKAEADLQAISDARLNRADIALPWIQFAGDQIQGAWIVESWQSLPAVSVRSPDIFNRQF